MTEECLKVGTAYYNSAVWLNDTLPHMAWKRLFTQHYRALGAIGDWKTKKQELELTRLHKELP